MSEFKDGQKIKSLYLPDGHFFTSGVSGIEEIVVVMQNGQMAGVPWFLVKNDNGQESMWNGALAEGVELLEAEANE